MVFEYPPPGKKRHVVVIRIGNNKVGLLGDSTPDVCSIPGALEGAWFVQKIGDRSKEIVEILDELGGA